VKAVASWRHIEISTNNNENFDRTHRIENGIWPALILFISHGVRRPREGS
jgi:hypothetical protein